MNNKFNNFQFLKKYLEERSINIVSTLHDSTSIHGISSITSATNKDITFFDNEKYHLDLKETKALACFLIKKYISYLPNNCVPIIVTTPYLCFAYTSNFFSPPKTSSGKISSNSSINKSSILKDNVEIGNYSSINSNVYIGENSIIDNNTTINDNVVIGKNSHIGSNVVISNAIIGDNTFIDSGTVIGGSGFGFTIDEKIQISHTGNVVIHNNVNIGSNCVIDRASIDSTFIGENVRLDNLIQIAHGVKIYNNTIIAGQVGIAGSTTIGSNCMIGGQTGISGHLKIGNNVRIAAKSGVTKNLLDNVTVAGFPAVNIHHWRRSIVRMNKI